MRQLWLIGLVALPSLAWAAELEYPVTKRVDHTDNYHGTTVADPYRWLEDDVRESEDVAAWVKSQNDVTFAYLGGGLDEVTYHADQTWVTQARRVLNDLTDAIAKEQFGESPGWWCKNCDFLRFCEPGQIEVSG